MSGEFQIVHGRVEDILPLLPDNYFDGVLCDPPYGLKFQGKRWDYKVPSAEAWAHVLRVCKPGAYLMAFGGPKTYHRVVCNIEDAGWEIRDYVEWIFGTGQAKSAPEEMTAKGYRSNLSPGHEPICVARKPLEGTLAENFARWGTGCLAVDNGANERGNWPKNVVLDEDAAAELDALIGERPSTLTGRADPTKTHENPGDNGGTSWFGGGNSKVYADSGGPSRFFYRAKVSRKERDMGCEDLPIIGGGAATGRKEGQEGLKNGRAGAGRTGNVRNNHPTLKPVALTTWLATLLLPPGPGRNLLVPFAGTGSEMAGGLRAGWSTVLGIEMEAPYIPIATRRIPALQTV